MRIDRSARTLLGIRAGEVRTIRDLVPPETLRQFGWLGEVVASTGLIHSSGTITGARGESVEVEYRVEALSRGGWKVRLRPVETGG
jgi:hypothetical protein